MSSAALRRVAWLVIGAAMTVFAVYEVIAHDLDPWLVVAFGVLPDVAFVAGIGQPHEPGRLPPRAVPAYNLVHRPAVPLTLMAVAVVWLLLARVTNQDPAQFETARRVPLYVFAGGIAWLAHVALDRALGFGLRTADGRQRNR